MPGNVYWKDSNGVFLGCNNNLAKIHNLESNEAIIGLTDYDMLSPKNASIITNNDNQIMKTKQESELEEHGFNIKKEAATYLTKKVPILDHENKVEGMVGISIDITERKKAEQELHKTRQQLEVANEIKKHLFNIINHEVRQPMHILLGMPQLLLNKKLSEFNTKAECYDYFRERVNSMLSSGNRLMSIINYVYDFIEQDMDDEPLPQAEIDLHDIITLLKRGNILAAEQKHNQLEFIIDKNTPDIIIVNYRRFLSIIEALIGNSIKYTKNGKITCSFGLNKKKLRVVITDTGIGMREEQIRNVCSHFDHHKEKSYVNSSLVLSICKKKIEMLGGNLSISSKVDKGTTMDFSIPIGISNKESKYIEDNYQPKILVIEDNEMSSIMLKELLQECNCIVDLAYSGKEAKRLLEQNSDYDLALVDLLLPDMLGYELIPDIKKSNKNTAIVAATAHFTEEDKGTCIEKGMDEVLQKPLFLEDIQEILKTYVLKPKNTG